MFPSLNALEQEIIGLFLDIDFSWKKALINQITSASVDRIFCDSSYFVNFSIPLDCDPIDSELRVPLTIIVDHQSSENSKVIYRQFQNIVCSGSQGMSPTGFNLHFRNGYLCELEVYSLGGDMLDFKQICTGSRTYFLLFQ